jgi:hypothetical protein
MAIVYLDWSGRTRKAVVHGWKSRIWDGSRGRYGWFCQFNLDPYFLTSTISDEAIYAGDGMNWVWHIKWS